MPVGTRCFGRTTLGMYWFSHHAQATIRMGVWIRMAAINLTIMRLALAPGISLLTFLSSSTSAIPISLGLTVLCEVSRRSKEDLNADATKNEGRDEVLDCALVNQGVSDASRQVHMSPSLSVMLSDCE